MPAIATLTLSRLAIAGTSSWPIASATSRPTAARNATRPSDGAKRSSALVVVDVTAPVLRATNDTASAVSGQAKTLQVLGNDQGTNLAVTAVSDPPHGTAVLNPDRSITYRSDAGYTGSDSFSYTISDGISQATAQVAVDVSAASSGVQLPDWPVSYTGATYYVSAAAPAGNALSLSRSNPGAAQHALNNAPSLSTIVFLGAGPYAALSMSRTTTTHLKLKSDVPAFTDLVNLRPTTLTAAQLNTLESSVVLGKDLSNSARLGDLTLKSGGYIWLEGFRSEFPAVWTMSSSNGGGTASSCAGTWWTRCRMWQGDGCNLRLGPQASDSVNRLNVVHKFWCVSDNEVGDPKTGGGTWVSAAGAGSTGTAITDYGIQAHQDTGAVHILECFIQMRANHMISFKRGVGENTSGGNRIQGCLFASWNRTFTRKNTGCEMGQEYDQGTRDYTTHGVNILDNTFVDPNMLVLYLKNVKAVNFWRNRVILMQSLLQSSLDGGSNDGTSVGPVHPGPFDISDNVILDTSPTCNLFSVGVATTITFARNTTMSPIALKTFASFLAPTHMAQTNPPRIAVVRTGGNASGFGTPVDG